MKNRKAAEAFIIQYIDKFLPGSPNKAMYEEKFQSMSDAEFDQWISAIGRGEELLVLVSPNLSKPTLNIDRNFKIAEELGHEFFQRVWLPSKDGKTKYLTPRKHLVYKLPIRRQAQLLTKKISIPKHTRTVDNLTGQPTGDSKGARVSFAELQILSALGLDKTVREFVKLRGGDEKGFNAMNTMISRQGSVSQAEIEPFTGTVKSSEVLRAYLLAAHLDNNLAKE